MTKIVDNIAKIKTKTGQMEVDEQRIDERVKNAEKNFDAQILKNLFEEVFNGTLLPDSTELVEMVSYMQSRYKPI